MPCPRRPRGAWREAATTRGTQQGCLGPSRDRDLQARVSEPSCPLPPPSRLTCYAGHTSRSGGPESPGTARMTCTAHSFPRALASPGRKGTRPQDLTRHIPRTPSSLTSSHYCVLPDPQIPGTPLSWDFLLFFSKASPGDTASAKSGLSPGAQGGSGQGARKLVHKNHLEKN